MSEAEKVGVSAVDKRPAMRPEDPRARAAARAAKIMDHVENFDEGVDKFYVASDDVPDGWEYEWKRHTVLGQEDPSYQVQVARTGWEPVPADRHPSYMPQGGKHKIIEREGMVLMERPKAVSDKVRAMELRKARVQVRTKEEQLNSTPDGHLPRDADPRTRAKVTKSMEPMEIPD